MKFIHKNGMGNGGFTCDNMKLDNWCDNKKTKVVTQATVKCESHMQYGHSVKTRKQHYLWGMYGITKGQQTTDKKWITRWEVPYGIYNRVV